MFNKQELLQKGSTYADKHCGEIYDKLVNKGMPEEDAEMYSSFHRTTYKAGYRKGLKTMRHTIQQAFDVYAKAHHLSPTITKEIKELLAFKK